MDKITEMRHIMAKGDVQADILWQVAEDRIEEIRLLSKNNDGVASIAATLVLFEITKRRATRLIEPMPTL